MKKFNAATGDPDLKIQSKLTKTMGLSYCSGVGKLIWAMMTCWPDLAFASVKLSQANACPHDHHFHGVKHCLKYLYSTCDNGIYSGIQLHALNLKKVPSHVSTAINKTFY
jgi:hypothetical protein